MSRKKNHMIYATVFVFLMTVATILASVQMAAAADVDTVMFISAAPNPVGVGEPISVIFWVNVNPLTAAGPGGDRWRGLKVEITKPDGTTETQGPFTSDPVGGSYLQFTPTMVGTYSFQASFPGQTLAAGENPYPQGLPYVGWNFKPSTSVKVSVTVQQQPVPTYPSVALPTGYWERPIYSENLEWSSISGNWLLTNYNGAGNRFNPYTKAPNTAHIVWKKPLAFGGLIGGEFGEIGYYEGMSYETKFLPPVIMNGVLYYDVFSYAGYTGGTVLPGFKAVDLRSGEELWSKNGTGNGKTVQLILQGFGPRERRFANGYPPLMLGQVFNYDSPNQHGGIPYLWGIGGLLPGAGRYDMYDAFTGQWILSLENASSGVPVLSPSGELLVYVLNGAANWLALWNSSLAIPRPGTTGSDAWQWRPPAGETLDWRKGIQWNVTIPDTPDLPTVQTIQKIESGVVLAATGSLFDYGGFQLEIGYDANTGAKLWMQNRTFPTIKTTYALMNAAGEGVYTEFVKETLTWYAYDIKTGEQLWAAEPLQDAFASYTTGSVIANGKLYAVSMDGKARAFDLKTGSLLWTYYAGSAGFETVYGTYPFMGGPTVADGKLYAITGEHSPSKPLWRGGAMHVIDLNTGNLAWKISGWWQAGPGAIADGYFVQFNGYDNQLYCFGKGKTAVELSASPTLVANGASTLIQGKVTDQSPAQQGTGVVPDQYMTAWMEYLHMQKPIPTLPSGANGVPVKLTATKNDGTSIDIGTVNADCEGNFKFAWSPPNQDLYSITAVFDGTESYWGSYATTSIGVSGPSPSPSRGQTVNQLPAEVFYVFAIVIIIILIIIAFLVLRRK